MGRAAWLLALALLGATPGLAADLQPVPPLQARVTDLTGTLTAVEQATLEQKLRAFEARKGAQVAVLIVASTAPEAIEQYSIRVVEAWKLGRAKPDDGALLLIAKDDHALRIEVGRGLEGALTDAMSNRIIEDTMVPLLRQGQFATAVNAGVDQMLRVIDGEVPVRRLPGRLGDPARDLRADRRRCAERRPAGRGRVRAEQAADDGGGCRRGGLLRVAGAGSGAGRRLDQRPRRLRAWWLGGRLRRRYRRWRLRRRLQRRRRQLQRRRRLGTVVRS
jgi:hypothetical protein